MMHISMITTPEGFPPSLKGQAQVWAFRRLSIYRSKNSASRCSALPSSHAEHTEGRVQKVKRDGAHRQAQLAGKHPGRTTDALPGCQDYQRFSRF